MIEAGEHVCWEIKRMLTEIVLPQLISRTEGLAVFKTSLLKTNEKWNAPRRMIVLEDDYRFGSYVLVHEMKGMDEENRVG